MSNYQYTDRLRNAILAIEDSDNKMSQDQAGYVLGLLKGALGNSFDTLTEGCPKIMKRVDPDWPANKTQLTMDNEPKAGAQKAMGLLFCSSVQDREDDVGELATVLIRYLRTF